MRVYYDRRDQPYIEWEQTPTVIKRAWVQRREGSDDWANTGRYLLVARFGEDEKPAGAPVAFPIWANQSDEQVLLAFVYGVNAATGGALELD